MNCSMCQEKLDERLDQLRARVQDGTVSRAAARAQGLVALQEVAGQCSECEAQLREHLNVRLAFLSAEPESVAVPPALRANVRRALERESARHSSFPVRRPWTSYAWTSGALLSALGLFLVARPLLIEKAQETPVLPSRQAPGVGQDQQAQAVPTLAPTRAPAAKQRARPLQSKPAVPKNSLSASSSSPAPQGKQRPDIAAAPSVLSQPPAIAVPAPPVVPSAPIRERTSPKQADVTPALPKKRTPGEMSVHQNQFFSAPSLTAPTPQVPGAASDTAASATSSRENATGGQPRLNTPAEPQLDKSALAPTGEKLGLIVRFSAPPRVAFGAMRAQGGPSGAGLGGFGGRGGGGFGGNGFGGGGFGGADTSPQMQTNGSETLAAPSVPKPKTPLQGDTPLVGSAVAAPTASSTERRVTALENRIAPPPKPNILADTMKPQVTPPNVATNPANNGVPNTALRVPQAFAGAGALRSDAGAAKSRLGANADAPLPLAVSVSVASPVIGARVQGRVKGKSEEDVLLWTGDLVASQPVSVSLVPLKVVPGDNVEISVEQQVSLGQARKLATTSVIVP